MPRASPRRFSTWIATAAWPAASAWIFWQQRCTSPKNRGDLIVHVKASCAELEKAKLDDILDAWLKAWLDSWNPGSNRHLFSRRVWVWFRLLRICNQLSTRWNSLAQTGPKLCSRTLCGLLAIGLRQARACIPLAWCVVAWFAAPTSKWYSKCSQTVPSKALQMGKDVWNWIRKGFADGSVTLGCWKVYKYLCAVRGKRVRQKPWWWWSRRWVTLAGMQSRSISKSEVSFVPRTSASITGEKSIKRRRTKSLRCEHWRIAV